MQKPTIYLFVWSNNSKRATIFNRRCRVICRGTKNSALVEFIDNKQREVVSRNSLRKTAFVIAPSW